MYKDILEQLNQHSTLGDDDIMNFFSILEFKTYPKNTVISKVNEVSNYLSFIVKGIAKSYVFDTKCNEYIIYFPKENWWFGDLKSFYSREPSSIQIETIEECEVIHISYDNLKNVLNDYPKIEKAAHNIIKDYTILCQERLVEMITLDAKGRYDKLVKKFPDIIQRVPQKTIAAYLGVTPEFLSKMKSKKII